MKHEPEFTDTQGRAAAEAKRQTEARVMACAYARLFSSDDGKIVLEDLRRKFGHSRPRFDRCENHHSTVAAALIDGECTVLREIEMAVKAGCP